MKVMLIGADGDACDSLYSDLVMAKTLVYFHKTRERASKGLRRRLRFSHETELVGMTPTPEAFLVMPAADSVDFTLVVDHVRLSELECDRLTLASPTIFALLTRPGPCVNSHDDPLVRRADAIFGATPALQDLIKYSFRSKAGRLLHGPAVDVLYTPHAMVSDQARWTLTLPWTWMEKTV